MVVAPPAFLPLVRGTPAERRPGGSTGLGSSLLATATRLGRKIEEQLRVRQGSCWRWWQRNLHGSRHASTSDYVRRSFITTPRSHAIFTSASVGGQVF